MGRGVCGKMYSSTLAPWTVCGLKEGQTSGCECRPLVNTVYSRRVGIGMHQEVGGVGQAHVHSDI